MVPTRRDVAPDEVEQLLTDLFPAAWLRETAREVGFVRRIRKIDPVAFFWVLVLGFGTGAQRTLAGLRRGYESVTAKTLVPSAFYDRFTPACVAFLRACFTRGLDALVRHTSVALGAQLRAFQDLVVADGTLIRLHDRLATQFPGVKNAAELKIHVVTGISQNTKSIQLCAGKTPDVTILRVGPWVRDHLLLFDLGYFKYQLFSRIRRNGGYFVSRIKTSTNPTIVRVLRTHRGRARDVTGQRLREVLTTLRREVLDVEVEVAFHRRAYRGRSAPATEVFRLVGIRDAETGRYHCFLTNLTPEQLSAEEVAAVYRARWTVELLFKELKRLYQLDVITSASPVVIEALVLATLLTMVVSHRILHHLRSLVPPDLGRRLTPLRWAEVFVAWAARLLERVLDQAGIAHADLALFAFMLFDGLDPNVHRNRLLDPWTRLLES